MADYRYSVVVPLFKSAAQLPALIDFIRFSFVENPASVQLIFVIDGCTQQYEFGDLSFFSNARIVYLKQNYGQYTATLCGLAVADAAWVITMDADMYYQPGLFSATLLYAGTSELVYADFTYRNRGIVRVLGSLVYNGIIKAATGKYHRHTGSSFRIIERELKKNVFLVYDFTTGAD
jgi:glycosyltransferase involved in cell wall biosynthesis